MYNNICSEYIRNWCAKWFLMRNFYAEVCFDEHFLWFPWKYNLITSAVMSALSFLGLLEPIFVTCSQSNVI